MRIKQRWKSNPIYYCRTSDRRQGAKTSFAEQPEVSRAGYRQSPATQTRNFPNQR